MASIGTIEVPIRLILQKLDSDIRRRLDEHEDIHATGGCECPCIWLLQEIIEPEAEAADA